MCNYIMGMHMHLSLANPIFGHVLVDLLFIVFMVISCLAIGGLFVKLTLLFVIVLYNLMWHIIILLQMVVKVDDIILGIAVLAIVASQFYFLRKATEIDKRRSLAYLFRTCVKCNKDFCMDYTKCEQCMRCVN